MLVTGLFLASCASYGSCKNSKANKGIKSWNAKKQKWLRDISMNYLITNNSDQSVYPGIQLISVDTAVSHLKKCEVVGVDTETTGFDWNNNTLLLLQISTKEDNYVFDCTTVDISLLKNMFLSNNVTRSFTMLSLITSFCLLMVL